MFRVCAASASNYESEAGIGGQHTRPQPRANLWIPEAHVERIVHNCALAFSSHVSRNPLRRSKENESLIEQMRSQIEQHAAPRLFPFAPGIRSQLGTKAVVVRFKANHLP